jgi:hypothetical protein
VSKDEMCSTEILHCISCRGKKMSIDLCLHYVQRMTSLTLIPNLPIIEDIALKNINNCANIKESFEQKSFVGEDRKC